MVIARQFIVRGRVQGVGFRYFTEDRARQEGVSGHVRNLADGAVEIVADGDEEAVERFERAVRRGPAGARVESCEVTELGPGGFRRGFSIRL